MCIRLDEPTSIAEISKCPHVDAIRFGGRIHFCGCCYHYMCDMCAVIHPMPTLEEEKRLRQFPCHEKIKLQLFEKERQLEMQLVRRYKTPIIDFPFSVRETHIDTIV
jgi:hypothetical protein